MFSPCIIFLSTAPALSGQPVVSVRSGLVHFFEGSVSIDGQPLEQRFGRFCDIKPGSELRTDQGRAEVLLTPGVFLRVDENSSIRMLDNRLTGTRAELIGGPAMLLFLHAAPGSALSIAFYGFPMPIQRPCCVLFHTAPPVAC